MAFLMACSSTDDLDPHEPIRCDDDPRYTSPWCERACTNAATSAPAGGCTATIEGRVYACDIAEYTESDGVVGCCIFRTDATYPSIMRWFECE